MLPIPAAPPPDLAAAAPDPAAVIRLPHARITLLTSRLLRIEFSPQERFEDRPSQAFWYRRQPAPAYARRETRRGVEIETEHLLLRYRPGRPKLTPGALSVTVKATGAVWKYGDGPARGGNLRGTARTLDERLGSLPLEPGLLGRSGWAVIDDTAALLFNRDGWLAPRQPEPEARDLYFFGYGRDYPACLQDFCRVAGPPPLPPRWALGNWWSRYWAYSASELLELMGEFRDHDVPLSVCIVDMDWHITRTGNSSTGWTGYTWNTALFPDPPGFLAALHSLGLKTALNLHPAEGIHPHEAAYPEFARLLGQDPAEARPIAFDLANPGFAGPYFDRLHHPLEAQGVDFWWIDWQQGRRSTLPGLDPLWWLNHLHFHDLGRDGVKRPFIFSRWGGLGNHRYPIGFSGDTIVNWPALDFQPYFTATAANVGYGWWSHDIGGHMHGQEDDELYTRWVQFGVFSPIFRLHSTKRGQHERRPWGRGAAAARIAGDAMRLRHRLIPYIYTMAWRNHTTGLPLVAPLYYSHPDEDAAYRCPNAYWFGSQLLAAPFTRPADPQTGLSTQTVWLPPVSEPEAAGQQGASSAPATPAPWTGFFDGQPYPAGEQTITGGLESIPVFARPGALVPLGPPAGWGSIQAPADLHLLVFPGASNRFELYEDDGETQAYRQGQFAQTSFVLEWQPAPAERQPGSPGSAGAPAQNVTRLRLTAGPASGDLACIPANRTLTVHLRGFPQPTSLVWETAGPSQPAAFTYDEATRTLSLSPVPFPPGASKALSARF